MPRSERAPSRILPLDHCASAQVKASSVITNLNDVVEGLLVNSLDAAATRIEISVDYPRLQVTVEDNGNGIPAAEFGKNGGLGRMHRRILPTMME